MRRRGVPAACPAKCGGSLGRRSSDIHVGAKAAGSQEQSPSLKDSGGFAFFQIVIGCLTTPGQKDKNYDDKQFAFRRFAYPV